MIKNIIKEKDEIKAYSFNRNGEKIASIYDKGFPSVGLVISDLSKCGLGCPKEMKEISIKNKSRGTYARYNKRGRSMKVTFENAKEYLINTHKLSLAGSRCDFDVSTKIKDITLRINRTYFISIGEYEEGVYEVFELHHGAQISEDGEDYITDGELWQYKLYKSLKRAIDYAMKQYKAGYIKDKPIYKW